MVLRVLGLKEEDTYGNLKTGVTEPDIYTRLSDGSFKLGDEAITYNDGSRMVQGARAGAIKPSGSTSFKLDLKRMAYYLKAFFDQYSFTAGNSGSPNIHKAWGSEGQDLTSFHAWATFDYFQKIIEGLLCESLKFEVSDEYMTGSAEWIYKNESFDEIDQSDYNIEKAITEGAIPLMFYDVNIELNNSALNGVVFTSFSFEGKNNLNQDATIGLGSRAPQRKARAQAREITMSIASYMSGESDFLNLLKLGEYGAVQTTPSGCSIGNVPLRVDINVCEDTAESMVMFFPKATINVEYSASESDEMEVTFNLTSLGTGDMSAFTAHSGETLPTLQDSDGNNIKTDCFCYLLSNTPEITKNVIEEDDDEDDEP